MIHEYYIKFTNSHFKVRVTKAQQHMVYGCFLTITADLSSCNRDSVAQKGTKPQILIVWSFMEKSLRLYFRPFDYIASYKAFLPYFPTLE